MALVPLTPDDRKEGAIKYLQSIIDKIEHGDFAVEEFSALVENVSINPGDMTQRRARTITIKEIWPR